MAERGDRGPDHGGGSFRDRDRGFKRERSGAPPPDFGPARDSREREPAWDPPPPFGGAGKRGRYDDRGSPRFGPPGFQPPPERGITWFEGAPRHFGGGPGGFGRGGFGRSEGGARPPSEFRGPPGFDSLLGRPAGSKERGGPPPARHRSASPPRQRGSSGRDERERDRRGGSGGSARSRPSSPTHQAAGEKAAGEPAGGAGAAKLSILGVIESLDHDLAEVQGQLQSSRADVGRLQQREAHIAKALERLESKPPKLPATAADSGSDVSDVELSESEESEAEAPPQRGGRRRGAAGGGGQEVQSAGGRDVAMPDAPSTAVLAAWGGAAEAAAPSVSASTALAVEEWEVWEPAAEDSGEEWGGGRRGKGRRGGKRGGRKKERAEAAEAEKRAARHALPPRQRLALRALGAAASGVAAEGTVADVLRQAQRQAAEAHASFAAAVPDALLVPAGTADAPEVGVAGGPGGRAGSGKIAALLAGRPAKVGDLLVPSTAPAFEQLTDLPQYRRNLESHCQARVGVQKVLRREFAALLRKHVELAVQYRMRYEAYKAREAERAAALREQLAAVERAAAAVGLAGQGRQQSGGLTNAQQPLSPTARTTSRGRSGDYIRSDWEEKQAIATLQAIELVKHCCELPRMEILPPRVARWEAYEDRNRLISDPEADEEASWYVRPWTEEERKVFADKFLLHHKDFPKIATFLPGRTVQEVVRLYYAIQRTDEFSQTRRKYLLRKRREQTESNKSLRSFGNFMGGFGTLTADLEMAQQQRGGGEEQRGAGLGRSNSRGSGLNGGMERAGRSRSRAVLLDATGPLAAAPIEFFAGAPPPEPLPAMPSFPDAAALGGGTGRRGGRGRAAVDYSELSGMGEEGATGAGLSMRRSRTAPTALGGATALSAASLPAGLDQLPVDLTAGFASLPPLPLGAAAGGLLPVGAAPLGLAGLSAPLPGTNISASLIGGSAATASAAFAAPFGAAGLAQLPLAGAGLELPGMGQPKRSTVDADLDARFGQAVRLFGRDLKAVSQFLGNKTVAATRLYWSRHRERLGLDGIMSERAAAGLGPEDHAPGAATAVPVAPAAAAAAGLPDLQQSWAPLLDHLQRQGTAGEVPADLAALPAPAEAAAAGAQPAAAPAAGAAAAEAVAEPDAMQVDATAEAAAVKPEPEAAAGLPAQPLDATAAAAAGLEQAAAAEGAAAQAGVAPSVGEQAAAAAGGEGAATPVTTAAEAASLLPREELTKLQTLLEPGGILFEFAGGEEAAAELRQLLRKPEQLVQHPGHMQQLIGMQAAPKHRGGRKRKGEGDGAARVRSIKHTASGPAQPAGLSPQLGMFGLPQLQGQSQAAQQQQYVAAAMEWIQRYQQQVAHMAAADQAQQAQHAQQQMAAVYGMFGLPLPGAGAGSLEQAAAAAAAAAGPAGMAAALLQAQQRAAAAVSGAGAVEQLQRLIQQQQQQPALAAALGQRNPAALQLQALLLQQYQAQSPAAALLQGLQQNVQRAAAAAASPAALLQQQAAAAAAAAAAANASAFPGTAALLQMIQQQAAAAALGAGASPALNGLLAQQLGSPSAGLSPASSPKARTHEAAAVPPAAAASAQASGQAEQQPAEAQQHAAAAAEQQQQPAMPVAAAAKEPADLPKQEQEQQPKQEQVEQEDGGSGSPVARLARELQQQEAQQAAGGEQQPLPSPIDAQRRLLAVQSPAASLAAELEHKAAEQQAKQAEGPVQPPAAEQAEQPAAEQAAAPQQAAEATPVAKSAGAEAAQQAAAADAAPAFERPQQQQPAGEPEPVAAATVEAATELAIPAELIDSLARMGLEAKLGRPVSEADLCAWASCCLDAGMSDMAVCSLLDRYPKVVDLEPSALAPKLSIIQAFMAGHMQGRTNAFAFDALCAAAALAALHGRSDAAVESSCRALDQLLEAAHGDTPRGAAVLTVPHRVQRDLLCSWDGEELLSRFQQLRSQEGWTAQRAAAELLKIDLQQELPDLSFIDDLEKEECGVEGEELAFATQTARANWPAVSVASAQEAVQGLQNALVPPREAAILWLSCGIEVTTPRFLTVVHQLRQAGVVPERLLLFAQLGRRLHEVRIPVRFAAGMFTLCALCGGSWAAAMEAAEAHTAPMLNLTTKRSAELLAVCQRLSQLGLPLDQLLPLAAGALSRPATLAAALDGLAALLGGDHRAMGAAVAAKPALLQVERKQRAAVYKLWQQLGQLGLRRGDLLRLAESAAKQPEEFERSLCRLTLLLGDAETAARMAGFDRSLLRMPAVDAELRQAFGQAVAAGASRWHLLQVIKATRGDSWQLRHLGQHFQQLAAAGLRPRQLFELTQAFGRSPDAVSQFAAMAEGLFGGDWRAAATALLADAADLATRLPAIQRAVESMATCGLEVAGKQGSQRVLDALAAGKAGSLPSWRVSIPEGTPAEERRAAAEAALAAVGFRAVEGQALRAREQLVAGDISSFGMESGRLQTWK
ncbi:hypothetical protein C2E21_8607 [Chlorella sorokiniana]|uniref:SANT domain-containing protein n=1 Tax=Chlorella sorokiniana TaxID=3076 RepID=A0A2P6TE43_CHLSO|nr:hypothetical protein C2E21_8607 [Chlorella sorokiniana]|eukprot:PRW20913.1 hypothetical protein C2E21_8607 [Chlorella sorokiniana]